MNGFATQPYGHKFCPNCKLKFQLQSAVPVFKEQAPHNDTIVYFMCRNCAHQFNSVDSAGKKAMMNQCFKNFKGTPANSDGNFPEWAITTTLTIALNGYDFFHALEYGHQLNQRDYFAICARDYEVVLLAGGLRIICSDLKEVSSNENK